MNDQLEYVSKYVSNLKMLSNCKFSKDTYETGLIKRSEGLNICFTRYFCSSGILFNALKVVCTLQRPIWNTELIRESRVLTDLTSVSRHCAHSSLKSGRYIKAFRCTFSVKRIRAMKLCGFLTATIHFSNFQRHTRTSLHAQEFLKLLPFCSSLHCIFANIYF